MADKTQESILIESLNRIAVRQFDKLVLDNTAKRLNDNNIKSSVISFEVPKGRNEPFKVAKVKIATSESYSGVIGSNSKWAKEPAAGWLIESLGVGLFKVTHNLGTFKYSINSSLLGVEGKIEVLGSDEENIIFEIRDSENELKDLDFIFSLSITSSG